MDTGTASRPAAEVPSMPRSHHTRAPDLRGHGASGKPEDATHSTDGRPLPRGLFGGTVAAPVE